MSQKEKRIDDYIQDLRKKINENLLIPIVYISNQWTINGMDYYVLYLKYPFPMFLLGPLYETFKNAFIKLGIDPDGDVTISKGRKRKRLLFKSQKTSKVAGCITKKSMDYLLVRWSEKRITFTFNPHDCRLSLHRNADLNERPPKFIYNILKNLNYPYYVMKDAVINDKLDVLVITVKNIEMNNATGWQIRL